VLCYPPARMPLLFRNLVWLAAAVVAIVLVTQGGDAVRLLALPVAALSFWRLGETTLPGLARRISSPARAVLAPLLIVLAAAALYYPLLCGDLPVNHDHPVLLLRAWTAWRHLSPLGVSGFETGQMAGTPTDGFYPVGAELLVAGLRLLSAGLLSWEMAYCLAFLLALLAYPLALYALGHRMGGWVAGLAAGLLGLVDRGAWLQPGWDFTANWGAWGMSLSFSLCLWTVWALDRFLLRRVSVLATTLVGLAAGIALLCHPMAVAILGVAVPLLLLLKILEDGPGSIWERLPALVAAGALAGALPAFWLCPFVMRQAWYGSWAYVWRPFEDVAGGLLNGELLKAFSPLLVFAGLAGLALTARRGVKLALFFLVGALLLLFVSTDTFLVLFGLLERFPSLGQLQYERFAYFIRTAFVLGAGLLLGQLTARAQSVAVTASRPAWRTQGLRLLLLAVAAPFALYSVRALPGAYFIPAKRLDYASKSDLYRDLRASAEYLRSLPATDVGRVALYAPTHEHVLLLLRVESGVPIFKVGFTSDYLFSGKFETQDREVWRALGVRHVLALDPFAQPDLQEVRRFGRLVLYRLMGGDGPSTVFTLRGPGQAAVVREAPEEMVFSLSGTKLETRLVVHRAAYALWHAEQRGRELPIARTRIGRGPPVFIEIAAGDGELTLRYRAGAPERVGAALSWLGWLTVAGVLAAAASRRLRARLANLLGRRPVWVDDAIRFGAAGLVALAALWLGWRMLMGPASPYPGREVVANLAHLLPMARADIQRGPERERCRSYDGGRLRCPGADWHYVGEVVLQSERVLRQCIWLHPVKDARLNVHFNDVPLGDHLQGNFGLDDLVTPEDRPGPYDVTLLVALDGHEVGRFTCPTRQGWHAWEVATPGRKGTRGLVTVSSEAAGVARHDFCFTAASTSDIR
jgi:hypothetical protein